MTSPDQNVKDNKADLIEHYLKIADEMLLTHEDHFWRVHPEGLAENLKDYSEEFLQAISPAIEPRNYNTEAIFHQIALGIRYRSEDFILDSIHFHNLIGGDEYLMTSSLIELLGKYEDSTNLHHPYREASKQEQQEYLALCKFVLAFQYRGEDYDWECSAPKNLLKYDGQHMGRTYAYYILDPKMVEFIREHWNHVDQITDIIKEREVITPQEILPILTATPSPMNKGVL